MPSDRTIPSPNPTAPSPRRTAGPPPASWLVWTALLTLYVVWGSTYLGIRVAVETIPPFLMAAVRFFIAGALVVAACVAFNRQAIRWPNRVELRDTAIVGGCLLLGGMGLVARGEQSVPSGVAALFVATMPVWLAVIGWLVYRERQPRAVVLGIVVGLAGVAILAAPGGADHGVDPLGLVAVIVSPISWAAGSVYAARHPRATAPAILGLALEMLIGSGLLALAGIATGELGRLRVAAISTDSLLAVGYLIVVGSLVGYTAYGWLLRTTPLALVSTYAYVNPIVAVGLGALLLSEPIEARTLVAGAVIVFSVALIITARGRMARSRTADAVAGTDLDDHRLDGAAALEAHDRATAAERRRTAEATPALLTEDEPAA